MLRQLLVDRSTPQRAPLEAAVQLRVERRARDREVAKLAEHPRLVHLELPRDQRSRRRRSARRRRSWIIVSGSIAHLRPQPSCRPFFGIASSCVTGQAHSSRRHARLARRRRGPPLRRENLRWNMSCFRQSKAQIHATSCCSNCHSRSDDALCGLHGLRFHDARLSTA